MLPIIVLIGRTNVGKSTLFNVLTKKRNALVSNLSDLTRDRNYELCHLGKNEKCILADTAGFDFSEKTIKKEAHQQTLIAMQESDLILFVVNARDGVLPQEYEILKKIRKHQKRSFLVINKIDGIKETEKINTFYSLGFKKYIKISASHNQGINDLINKHLTPWIKLKFKKTKIKNVIKNEEIKNIAIKIAFVGKTNVGKSTLINAFSMQNRVITSNTPGTTLDTISVPIKYHNKNYILIDTAGASKNKKKKNKIEQISIIKTLEVIEKTDITLLIIDAKDEQNKICNQNLLLKNIIEKFQKPLIIIINKWDLLNFSEKNKFKILINNQLKNYLFLKIYFISALNNKGIFPILKFIEKFYYFSSQKKINTSKLMKIMKIATEKHQPPMINGRRIKLKYIHLGSNNPIKIIIHGNQIKHLSLTYKKYLKKFFCQALQINGIPIEIKFKETTNPYIKNTKKY